MNICSWMNRHTVIFSIFAISSWSANAQAVLPGPTGINDTYGAKQWNLTAINAPQAWSLVSGNTKKVRVATIDSENSVHPDVRWARDAAGNSLVRSRISYAHGTHVAGIIAAIPNNAQGIAGVCNQCEIIPVIYAVDDDARLAEAIKLAIRLDAQVINMSLELRNGASLSKACTDSSNSLTREAIAKAIAAGVTVVASAGNYGKSFDSLGSDSKRIVQDVTPASCPGVISVGAVDQFLRPSSYTNDGATLMAPGGGAGTDGAYGASLGCSTPATNINHQVATTTVGVVSTWTENGEACYRHLSGTSMASPHVAGVVGMMLAANPTLSPLQIETILKANTTSIANCLPNVCGAGLVDAAKSVNMALGTVGAMVAYRGICKLALGETCKIDTFDELPNGTISVTAYGKMWNFNQAGVLLGEPLALTNNPTYVRPLGPCSANERHPSGLCTFDVREVIDYPGIGYLDSVVAGSYPPSIGTQDSKPVLYKYWNYLASGQPLLPEGGPTDSVARYKNWCPKIAFDGSFSCVFDTRAVVNYPEWGGVVEAFTTSDGRYKNFDGAGNVLAGESGSGFLKDIPKYSIICGSKFTCRFDARALKANRNEVVIAYGKYFEFSGGVLLQSYALDSNGSPFR